MHADDELIAAHLRHLEHLNRRPSTIDQRRRVLNRLQRSSNGHGLLGADQATLLEYLDRPLAPSSRAIEITHLQGFYGWALDEGLVEHDPSAKLARPKRTRRLPRPMPDEDVARALVDAPERVRPWLYLAAYAGLRACEVSGLRAEHITWDAEPPVIFVEVGKGGGMSAVPMSAALAAALRDCALPGTGWLFPRRDGQDGPTPPWLVSQRANQYLPGRR